MLYFHFLVKKYNYFQILTAYCYHITSLQILCYFMLYFPITYLYYTVYLPIFVEILCHVIPHALWDSF